VAVFFVVVGVVVADLLGYLSPAPAANSAGVVRIPVPPGAYAGEATADFRYLFVTHARQVRNGVSRIDLDNYRVETLYHDHPYGHLLQPLSDRNMLFVVGFSSGAGALRSFLPSARAPSVVMRYSIEPFAELGVDDCAPYEIVRPRASRAGSLVLLSKAEIAYVAKDVVNPCNDLRSVVLPRFPRLRGAESCWLGVSGLEQMAPLGGDKDLAWMIGNVGDCMSLVDLTDGTVVRTVKKGWLAWDACAAIRKKLLFISRSFWRRVDIRDLESGALIDTVRLAGATRALAVDEAANRLYVGYIIRPFISVIDLTTRREIARLSTKACKTRRLIFDAKRRKLLAVGDDGVTVYDVDRL
jgi:hypothetical protein